MNPDLTNLIKKTCIVTSDKKYDLVILWPERINLTIKDPELFWNEYVKMEEKEETGLCLAEFPTKVSMLKISFSIFSKNTEFNSCNPKFLNKVIYECQEQIRDKIEIDDEDHIEFISSITKTDNHKNTLSNDRVVTYEIYFNFCHCPTSVQTTISHNIERKLKSMKDLPDLISKSIKGTFQFNHIQSHPRLLYGSSYTETSPRFHYITSYSHVNEILESHEVPLSVCFMPTNHPLLSQSVISVENESDDEAYPDELLSLITFFFSNQYVFSETPKLKKVTDKEQKEKKKVIGLMNKKDMAKLFMKLISDERYLVKTYWIKIGKSLHTTFNADDVGLSLWIEATKNAYNRLKTKTPKFIYQITKSEQNNPDVIEETCSYLYDNWKGIRQTVKTIAWYASEDSPHEYEEWHNSWTDYFIQKSISNPTDTNIAIALSADYWLKYICAGDSKNGVWYRFRNHRYIKDMRDLNKKIGLKFVTHYQKILKEKNKQYKTTDSNDTKTLLGKEIGDLKKIIKDLQSDGIQRRIISQACLSPWFKCDNFYDYLDTDSDIFGVENGVFEVTEDEIIFRVGQPEDYISKSTNVRYRSWYSWNNPQVVNCMIYLRKVFPCQETLHLFLKFMASCLRGENIDKIFVYFTGIGNNSKSMLIRLIQEAFGSGYVKKSTGEDLVQKKASSGPTPEMARKKGARIVIYDELDHTYSLSTTKIKREIGRDDTFARNCNENGSEFTPTHKSIASANVLPSFNNPDDNILEKVLIFDFISTWSKDAPSDINEQYKQNKFPLDPYFDRNLPFYAHAFLWILKQYYSIYVKEGLVVPESIIKRCNEYWDSTDIYKKFIDKFVEPALDEEGNPDLEVYIDKDEIYGRFTDWFEQSYRGKRVPNIDAFTDNLSRKWDVEPEDNLWFGVRLIDVDEKDKTMKNKRAVNFDKKRKLFRNSNVKVSIPKEFDDIPRVEKKGVGRRILG